MRSSSGSPGSGSTGFSSRPSFGSSSPDGHRSSGGTYGPSGDDPPERPGPVAELAARALGQLTPQQLLAIAGGLALVAFVVSGVTSRREGRSSLGWTTGSPLPQPEERDGLERAFAQAREADTLNGPGLLRAPEVERQRQRVRDVSQAIRVLGGKDDDFSVPVFEDFVTALYHAANERRGNGRLDELSPYLNHSALITYRAMPAQRVDGIVVGTLSEAAVFAVHAPVRELELQIVFSANYTETDSDGTERRYVLNELWTLVRSPDITSRAPEKARIIGCPNCGAPVATRKGREPGLVDPCAHCGQVVDPGAFDWRVVDIRVRFRETNEAVAFGDVEEIGTDYPTVIDPEAQAGLEALQTRDPSQTWPAFVARVVLVYETLGAAWNSGDLRPARPFLTDTLFETQSQLLSANRRRGLENQLVDARTSFIELARVTRDRHYDALTVRVHAAGCDYTLDGAGKVVAGSRNKRREYTEYWTFLRAAAHEGPPRVDLACPSCGATVTVNLAGRCDHCNVKITRGDFDWVLSRIEQDESYRV